MAKRILLLMILVLSLFVFSGCSEILEDVQGDSDNDDEDKDVDSQDEGEDSDDEKKGGSKEKEIENLVSENIQENIVG